MNPDLSGSPFAWIVRRKPTNNANNVPMRTAAERNVRPPLQISPQEAPDPIRQGDTPARWAHMPVVVFRFDEPYQEDIFTAPLLEMQYAGHTPHGRQSAFAQRSNIRIPAHVAYGSLFTNDQPVYGMG